MFIKVLGVKGLHHEYFSEKTWKIKKANIFMLAFKACTRSGT